VQPRLSLPIALKELLVVNRRGEWSSTLSAANSQSCYMLFILNANGVPSVASIVKL
jgi:hypothetical protein